MARSARTEHEGACTHVINRTSGRRRACHTEDGRKPFLQTLRRSVETPRAFGLMPGDPHVPGARRGTPARAPRRAHVAFGTSLPATPVRAS